MEIEKAGKWTTGCGSCVLKVGISPADEGLMTETLAKLTLQLKQDLNELIILSTSSHSKRSEFLTLARSPITCNHNQIGKKSCNSVLLSRQYSGSSNSAA
ncbi:Uncharacterized protein TCM_037211 [Theobroma cacao]|uniref:Uncharacterized protein n=1 Tax=Theobroma cacao TaxID=3641 RepID=A0A061GKU6_THECC|nr:Uncharacterized protein TCM_037211 [Theobroma cacao]